MWHVGHGGKSSWARARLSLTSSRMEESSRSRGLRLPPSRRLPLAYAPLPNHSHPPTPNLRWHGNINDLGLPGNRYQHHLPRAAAAADSRTSSTAPGAARTARRRTRRGPATRLIVSERETLPEERAPADSCSSGRAQSACEGTHARARGAVEELPCRADSAKAATTTTGAVSTPALMKTQQRAEEYSPAPVRTPQ